MVVHLLLNGDLAGLIGVKFHDLWHYHCRNNSVSLSIYMYIYIYMTDYIIIPTGLGVLP